MPAGRPRKPIRSVAKNIQLPEDIVAAVELRLYSAAERRVPQGAWQGLLVELLTQWLKGSNP